MSADEICDKQLRSVQATAKVSVTATGPQDLSPFQHIPDRPGSAANALPTSLLIVIAAAFTTIGLIGFARRDIG